MNNSRLNDQLPFRFQILNDLFIGGFNVEAFEIGYFVCEHSCVVYRAGGHVLRGEHTVRDGYAVVVVAECGRLMHYACSVFGGDVWVDEDAEGFRGVLVYVVMIRVRNIIRKKKENTPVQ